MTNLAPIRPILGGVLRVALVGFFLFSTLLAGRAAAAEPGVVPVPVQIHVMSQCPYALDAENSIAEVVAKLGSNVALDLEYIGIRKENGTLASMHGPDEVKGDIAQLCARKHTARWLDFVRCQNRDMADVATNWTSCATEVGAPVQELRSCIEGGEGEQLLAASFLRSSERGAPGSPTFFIGGKRYEGGRRPAQLGRAICAAFEGRTPAACSEFPPPPPVNVTFLSDSRCEDCDASRFERLIRRTIANPAVQHFDYSSPEGKRLYAAVRPASLPLAVFDVTLDRDLEAAAELALRLETKGTFRILAARAVGWNPECADPGGCGKPECQKLLACRPNAPRRLEVAVMSYCPFCVKGLASMREVLDHFRKAGAPIDFRIQFVGEGDAKTGFSSLHGEKEVAENLREACVVKKYAAQQRFLEYVWCRNRDLSNPDWRACATPATGIDPGTIEACANGPEGKRLLEESYRYTRELGIGASPTWLVNGRHMFQGIDADRIRREYCKHNPGPGCASTPSANAPR